MNEGHAIGIKKYEVNSFLVNPRKRMGLFALLNVLQDAAWAHATEQGHGHRESLEKELFWVLTRQHLVMERWPAWGDEVEIRTWVRPTGGSVAMRDYEIYDQGEKVGECTTGWLLLHAGSRKPTKEAAEFVNHRARTDATLSLETPKIEPVPMTERLARFEVRNSDIDMNDHVNNTKYAQWILDAMPAEWHGRFELKDYQINFLAESKLGDAIEIYYSLVESEPGSDLKRARFQGIREGDRKPIFTSILAVVPIDGAS